MSTPVSEDDDLSPEPGSPTPARLSRPPSEPTQVMSKPISSSNNASSKVHDQPSKAIHHSPRPPISPSRSSRKKSRHQYGDRYIPNRNGINLQAAFSLVKDEAARAAKPNKTVVTEISHQKIEEANRTFSTLLKAEIFGSQVPSVIPTATSPVMSTYGERSNNASYDGPRDPITPPRSSRSAPATPNRNLFRYQSPNRKKTYTSVSGLEDDFPIITPSSSFRTHHKSPGLENDSRLRRHDRQDETASSRAPETQSTPSRRSSRSPPESTRIAPEGIDPTHEIYSLSPVRLESQRLLLSPRKQPRGIPKIPYKVLDAPELVDDFYLNLVDWGSQNTLGVGLGNCVYLWHAQTSSVNKLCDMGSDDLVTSISWIKRGTHLAVGTKKGLVQIWDAEKCKRIRTMTGHEMRAGSLAWNEHILSSGSRDRTILHRDVRIPEHYVTRLTGHKQEVCGLKWNTDENQLASGGNDNKLIIWDGMNEKPLYKFTDHFAAVKAIAWSPHSRGLLATGGGTADRRIRFWNTLTGTCLNEIDTGSQVCNLAWSKTSNELVSTHGYSKNQVVIWKYPSMQQVAALTGHSYRVLYLAMSPDGRTIVTGAGDETLRFWDVFGNSAHDSRRASSLLDVFPQLR